MIMFFNIYIYVYSGCETERSLGEVHIQNNSYHLDVKLVFH